MQILNILLISILMLIQIAYLITWINSDRLLILNISKLYLLLPAKILYILLAKEFAVKLHVQSQQQSNGDLIVRGVDENGETLFQFEIHVQQPWGTETTLSSSRKESILEGSFEDEN